jgi:hypothetical protein
MLTVERMSVEGSTQAAPAGEDIAHIARADRNHGRSTQIPRHAIGSHRSSPPTKQPKRAYRAEGAAAVITLQRLGGICSCMGRI